MPNLPKQINWRSNWARVIPFFAHPPEIRKVIYTTNAIESLNMSLRKVTKARGSFTNDEADSKLLFLALRNHCQEVDHAGARLEGRTHRFARHLRKSVRRAKVQGQRNETTTTKTGL